MSFEYKWTRDDLKKELMSRQYKNNVFYLVVAIGLYLLIMWSGISSDAFDTKKILLYGLVYVVIIMIFLFVVTKIYVAYSLKKNDKKTNKAYGTYHVFLTDDDITVKINDEVISYKYKDIDKKRKKKNTYFINTREDKLGLLFKRSLLKDDYDKLVDMIESKLKHPLK